MQAEKLDESVDNIDINDAFSDILMLENRIFEETYKEGYEKGKKEENVEAFHLGYHRGAELGAEIGYYSAVTESFLEDYKKNSPGDDKFLKELTTLQNLLKAFPQENDLDTDILALAGQIRSKFKKICAVLKIQPTFPEIDQLSF